MRAASDAKSLSERADEAVAWACLTIADIARKARDDQELRELLADEPAPSLREIWERRRAARR